MARITLAQFNGHTWLVAGEEQIDDLLANTLSSDATIELVACDCKADVLALWREHCGEPDGMGDPWLIHPAIVARIQRVAAGLVVRFAPWSAMLDREALAVIEAAGRIAVENPNSPVVLNARADQTSPIAAEMVRLRARLIEEKLAEAGLARDRFVQALADAAPGAGDDAECVTIVIQPT
jgi:hypothetical protein